MTKKIPTYGSIGVKFSGHSEKYVVSSSRPKASTYYIKDIVRMMLLPRIKTVLAGGKITTEQTQDSLWYNALPQFEEHGVKYSSDSRKHFKFCIRELCREHGIAREQIGIIAAPWGSMLFEGEWYDISFDTIKDLAKKGTDLVFIEKRDIVMAQGKYASEVGVALVNTHGHLSDYTEDLAELADISGAHIAIFTDYDIPGILIASTLKENVPRLGVDERMLDHFNINKNDKNISIPYNPKVDRLKDYNLRRLINNDKRFSPDMVDIDFLKHEKIEIDAILAAVGAERLWEYLKDLLKKEFPKRNYRRVIDPSPDLSKHYPPIVKQLQLYYDKRAREITEQESKKIEEELKDVEGFINVKEKEKEILDDRLGKIVLEDKPMKDIADALIALDSENDYKIQDIEIPKPEEEEQEEEPQQQDNSSIKGIDVTEEEAAKTFTAYPPDYKIVIPKPEITKADIQMHKDLCTDAEGRIEKDCIHTPLLCAKQRIINNFGLEKHKDELNAYWEENEPWQNKKAREEYLSMVDIAYRETMRQIKRNDTAKKEEGGSVK